MNEPLRLDSRQLSPYVRYVHEVVIPAGSYMPERHIFDYELIFVIKGGGTIRIENRIHSLQGGDLLYIRPHLANDMKVSAEAALHCFAVHFDYVFLGEGLDFSPYSVYLGRREEGREDAGESWLGQRPAAEPADIDIPEKMRVSAVQSFYDVFRQLCDHFENPGAASGLWLKSVMLQLIGLVHQELMTKEGIRIGHPHAAAALDAIAYMEEHYAEPIRASQLAKRASLSPKYFGTIFKEATGHSVAQYLLGLRMERAKKLLHQRKYTVREVADLVGIGDIYYFSKLFKRAEGISPKRYADSVSWLDRG